MSTQSIENWQAGKNVLGCNEYMFINQIYCDVTFKVGTEGKEVKAHKYVLASRSSVFAAMLYGSLSEANDLISVPDIETEAFDILLKFLYFEDHEIDESSVISTLYAAEKYAVTALVSICQSFLESKMTEDNVCVIMENASMFNFADLILKCKNLIFGIESVAKKVFESDGFLDLRQETLFSLVESDELSLSEDFIYQSVMRWAKHSCGREGKNSQNSAEIRKMLGNIIFEVRFPTLSLEKFWKDIVCDEILSDEEKIIISKAIAGKTPQKVVFKSSRRKRFLEILRSHVHATDCSWSYTNRVDAIDFEVNKPISLYGLLLYGNSNSTYIYVVEVKIISPSDNVLLHLLPMSVEGSCNIFQIKFDTPVQITPNTKYTVWAKLDGPMSYRGKYSGDVEYEGYTFKFYKSNYCNNSTSASSGQIPGLLCSLI